MLIFSEYRPNFGRYYTDTFANGLRPTLKTDFVLVFSHLRTAVGIFRCPAWDCADNIPGGLICC